MKAERSIQILLAGLKAAHGRLFQGSNVPKAEYPRNLIQLYGWAEDSLFNLFEAVRHRHFDKVQESAGDVIVLMSEMIEHAEIMERRSALPSKEEDTDEVAGD